jgi:hypothetical protein
MFCVDEPAAEAIRRALDEKGELAAVAELRRRYPLAADGDQARACVRAIASWRPMPSVAELARKPARHRR